MPELPEVQCFANDLNEKFAGKVISKVLFRRNSIRAPLNTEAIQNVLASSEIIVGFSRIGKRLILATAKGRISISLGMSGRFISSNSSAPEKHEHITIAFSDGSALGYSDPRRFGSWEALPANWRDVAVDGLDSEGLAALFRSATVRKISRPVKHFLLDQKFIGGVGNIYVVEALFRAGVNPSRPCSQVTPTEWKKLAHELPKIFEEAIEAGGSSISSYRRLAGADGGFQNSHRVYGRDGLACVRKGCKGIVVRVVQGGRASFYCPKCQH